MIKKSKLKLKSKSKSKLKSTTNKNTKIINVLTTVKNYYAKQKDTIHVNAYERAIYQIKHWDTEITSGNELEHLPGIGKGMIEKIDTILDTGTLPIIKEKGLDMSLDTYLDTYTYPDTINNNKNIHHNKTKKNKKYNKHNKNNLQSLDTHILGFGEIFMNKLKTQYGARTINDIRKLVSNNKIKLNNTQAIGLKYHEDLVIPIPRKEIKNISDIIKSIIEKYFVFLKCLLAGSYPSGTKSESKDIDILIVVNDDVPSGFNLYGNIINALSRYIPLETISVGNTKFMGLMKSPITDKWRHLDIRISLINNLPYAWLYYTGGKIFNKLIRERLKKKGYKLNEYGLYKDNKEVHLDNKYLDKYGIDDNGALKINEKEMMDYIEYVEKKVFEIAGMEYKNVKERY